MFDGCLDFALGRKRNARASTSAKSIGSHIKASNPLVTDEMRAEAEIRKDEVRMSKSKEDVMAFLHAYFAGTADCAPEEARVLYTKRTWLDIYKIYVAEHCNALGSSPVHYSVFCHVRATECKNYRRCRTTRKGGWNHLSCKVCDNLKRLISKAKNEESRKKYQARLDKHRRFQEQHRRVYYNTRAKAIRNSEFDVSMIVDAAGGTGSTHSPRYNTTEKNEPARHTMMKVTNTFAKIHGLGTLIVQSIGELEKKGGNLTVEVILRAVREALKARQGRSIRNLYVQLDNVSSNKCHSVIAGMAVLCLLGVVRKVKLSYLIVGHTHEDVDA
jgi:hypothetical protein